ncbi:MAG: phosphoribosylglycinamide formyltransferase [bacterium]
MADPIKLAVLLSGGGTTLENIARRIEDGALDAEVEVVIASRPDAYGLVRAGNHGIASDVIERKAFEGSEAFSEALNDRLDESDVDLVCLAGFMVMWKMSDRYLGRVMNIHPALIPAFCGKGYYGHRVHEAVLEYGAKVSGCTVHFADREYDHGPVIVQKCVPVLDGDRPETLAARVFEQECEAYPEAIQLFAEGRLRIEGRRVRVLPRHADPGPDLDRTPDRNPDPAPTPEPNDQ